MKPFVTNLKLIVVAENFADAIKKVRGANLPISCALAFTSFPVEVSADELEDLIFLNNQADIEESKVNSGKTYSDGDFPALDEWEKTFAEFVPKRKL